MDNRQLDALANYLAIDLICNEASAALEDFSQRNQDRPTPKKKNQISVLTLRDLPTNRCLKVLKEYNLPREEFLAIKQEIIKIVRGDEDYDDYGVLWFRRLTRFKPFTILIVNIAKNRYYRSLNK